MLFRLFISNALVATTLKESNIHDVLKIIFAAYAESLKHNDVLKFVQYIENCGMFKLDTSIPVSDTVAPIKLECVHAIPIHINYGKKYLTVYHSNMPNTVDTASFNLDTKQLTVIMHANSGIEIIKTINKNVYTISSLIGKILPAALVQQPDNAKTKALADNINKIVKKNGRIPVTFKDNEEAPSVPVMEVKEDEPKDPPFVEENYDVDIGMNVSNESFPLDYLQNTIEDVLGAQDRQSI